jgi:hypothetical protein
MPLDLPLVLSRVHWVRPELVAEVKFLTWTEEGLLRHAIYQGLREDKPETEVRRSPMHGALRRLPEPALPKGKPATGAVAVPGDLARVETVRPDAFSMSHPPPRRRSNPR